MTPVLAHPRVIDDIDCRIADLYAYLHRENVNPVAIAEAVRNLLAHPRNVTQEELALRLGKKKSWISDMLVILRLQPHLLAKVRAPEVVVPAEALTRIARLDNLSHQELLIDLVLKGASTREIRRRIKVLQRGPKAKISKRDFRSANGHRFLITRIAGKLSTLGMLVAAEEFTAVVRAEAENEARNAQANHGGPRLARLRPNGKPASATQENAGGSEDLDRAHSAGAVEERGND